MYGLIFSTNFVWTISHCKKNAATYCHKRTSVFMWSTRYFCQILINLEFYQQMCKNNKMSNFMKVRQVGAELFHADSDRHDEANSRFSKFCERA